MNACGNIRVCCDGAQQGCYSTQQLPWSVYLHYKEEKIPMENCTAGRSVVHYRGAPCWNDTINSIWAISNWLWASSLETLEGLHRLFCMFYCRFSKGCQSFSRFFTVFRHSRQPLVSIHLIEKWALKVVWDSYWNKIVPLWKSLYIFMVGYCSQVLQHSTF